VAYGSWAKQLLGFDLWRNDAVALGEAGWELSGSARAVSDMALLRFKFWGWKVNPPWLAACSAEPMVCQVLLGHGSRIIYRIHAVSWIGLTGIRAQSLPTLILVMLSVHCAVTVWQNGKMLFRRMHGQSLAILWLLSQRTYFMKLFVLVFLGKPWSTRGCFVNLDVASLFWGISVAASPGQR